MGDGPDPDLDRLRRENARLQAEIERLRAERTGLLAANARLVARECGADPVALVRATYGGSPTLTLRAFARFQGLDPAQDDRLINELLDRISGYQFIDPEEMSECCRELRRVLRALRPARALVCPRCGEPATLAAAFVGERYLSFRFHHRGSAATHGGTNDGRLPRLHLAINDDLQAT